MVFDSIELLIVLKCADFKTTELPTKQDLPVTVLLPTVWIHFRCRTPSRIANNHWRRSPTAFVRVHVTNRLCTIIVSLRSRCPKITARCAVLLARNRRVFLISKRDANSLCLLADDTRWRVCFERRTKNGFRPSDPAPDAVGGQRSSKTVIVPLTVRRQPPTGTR